MKNNNIILAIIVGVGIFAATRLSGSSNSNNTTTNTGGGNTLPSSVQQRAELVELANSVDNTAYVDRQSNLLNVEIEILYRFYILNDATQQAQALEVLRINGIPT